MRRTLLLMAAVMAVTACAKAPPRTYAEEKAQLMAPTAASNAAAAADAAAPASGASPQAKPPATAANAAPTPAPGAAPMLAYSYQYGVEAPPTRIRALVARRAAECVAAGPARCQLTGSNIAESGRD